MCCHSQRSQGETKSLDFTWPWNLAPGQSVNGAEISPSSCWAQQGSVVENGNCGCLSGHILLRTPVPCGAARLAISHSHIPAGAFSQPHHRFQMRQLFFKLSGKDLGLCKAEGNTGGQSLKQSRQNQQSKTLCPRAATAQPQLYKGPRSSLPTPSPSPVPEPSAGAQHLAFGATNTGQQGGVKAAAAAECLSSRLAGSCSVARCPPASAAAALARRWRSGCPAVVLGHPSSVASDSDRWWLGDG